MNLALVNIKQLVTVPARGKRAKLGRDSGDLGVIENAAVIVEGDRLQWIGRMEDLSMGTLKEADVLDCLEKVVMPGFVDAHTHLLFAGSREDEFGDRASGLSYADIAARGGGIMSTVKHVRSATKKDLKKHARHHLNALLKYGTTTVEIKSGYGLDTENEIKMLEAINELNSEEVISIIPTFLGAHAVPPEHRERGSYVDEILNTMIPYVGSRGLAAFCDVFCEEGYFSPAESREILEQGKRFGLKPKIHADQLSATGGAEIAAAVGAVSADHLENTTVAGIAALAEAGAIATILPGVPFFTGGRYAPARRLIDSGVPVAISTDFNPGTCMCYSMPIMMTIACARMGMTPEEAIVASTLNSAAAVGRSDEVGSLEVGKKADLIVLGIPNYRYLPYHFGENHVEKVVKDGVVLEMT